MNAARVVSFRMPAFGGLTGATSGQRVIGFGYDNSAGTASFTDDVGYFGPFNAANYAETYYHSAGAANTVAPGATVPRPFRGGGNADPGQLGPGDRASRTVRPPAA